MVIIPIDDLGDYIQTVVLEGFSYDIRLQYNPLRTTTGDGVWNFYIGNAGFDPVIQRKATVGLDLTEGFKHLNGVPPGNFYLIDIEQDYGRVTRQGFSESDGRFRLIYLKTTEVL